MSPDAGAHRLLRPAVFSTLTVLVAAAGHELAGGTVSLPGAGFAWLGVMVLINPLLGRRRGLPLLLPLMVGLQVGLHLAFMAGGAAVGGPASQRLEDLAAHGGHSRMGSAAMPMSGADAAPVSSVESQSAMGGWGLADLWSPMSLAHLFAALLLTVLFLRGEDVLTTALVRLGLRLPIVPAAVLPAPLVRLVVPARVAGCPPPAAFGRVIRRRGPPAASCQVGLLLG